MPTSGNTIATLSAGSIITAAGRKLLLGEGVMVIGTDPFVDALEALNTLVAEFRTLGMQAFLRTKVQVPLVFGQSQYTWGTGLDISVPYAMYIYDIEYVDLPSGSKIPMNQMAAMDFEKLPIQSNGIPVNYNYQPLNNTGLLSVWPIPQTFPPGSYMDITYTRPMEVFDTAFDDYDCPQEWGNALIYGLAALLAEEYGVSNDKYARLQKQAEQHLAIACSNALEQGSMFFQPAVNWDRTYYNWS